MSAPGKVSHPRDVLLGAQAAASMLPVCDHYSGVEARMRKSLQLQDSQGVGLAPDHGTHRRFNFKRDAARPGNDLRLMDC